MMHVTPPSVFRQRCVQLMQNLGGQSALLVAGRPRVRNYPANCFPFRAESHFLFCTGLHLVGAALLLHQGQSTLFYEPTSTHNILWHGDATSADDLRTRTAVDRVLPIAQIDSVVEPFRSSIATIPSNDYDTATWQSKCLNRPIYAQKADILSGVDSALADALIQSRLCHDDAAVTQMRYAATITERAYRAGFQAMRANVYEAAVRSAIEAEFMMHTMPPAYTPIVTRRGEVLHNHSYDGLLKEGDLLLVDAGAETQEGWACDVTRTWPVSGQFSSTQRAIYDVVLAAQKAAIQKTNPEVRYRDIHHHAMRVLVDGLVQLKIFHGAVDGLLERGAGSLFFPHGVGHLLGLDVHDMEDLGDRAGYAPDRKRSTRFGECYLRCDRDLKPGMAVTIEPGFYQIAALLNDVEFCHAFESDFNRAELAKFQDVRGIRLEDDVLVTENGHEVLTDSIPILAHDIEEIWAQTHT